MGFELTSKYIATNGYRAWINSDKLNIEELLIQLSNGVVLKETTKTASIKWKDYFVKHTKYNFLEGAFRHLFLKKRCRNAWIVSNYLFANWITTPQPIAYVEIKSWRFPYQHIICTEYLENYLDVENFIRTGAFTNWGLSIEDFLLTLYKLIVQLWELGIYHKDLAGKNLLTKDGKKIYLIDLDSVQIKKSIGKKEKILNIVQFYDSFCDFVPESILFEIIHKLLDASIKKSDITFDMIKSLQQVRRNKHINNKQTL